MQEDKSFKIYAFTMKIFIIIRISQMKKPLDLWFILIHQSVGENPVAFFLFYLLLFRMMLLKCNQGLIFNDAFEVQSGLNFYALSKTL